MLLFRSEEEVGRWCGRSGRARGAAMGVDQLEDLARRWYGDRLDPRWRPRSPAASQAILAAVGLTGPFWSLGPGLGE